MGILRLYLAICVVGSHSESVLPWGMHTGREAVQMFFIISGFYMQFILGGKKYESVRNFYFSRAFRIFVPYFTALLLVIAVSVVTGLAIGQWLTLTALIHHEQNGSFGVILATLTNGLLFFQDWVMFLQHDKGEALMFTSNFWYSKAPLWQYLWIPQAWSVGIELTFYVFAPLLIRKLSTLHLFILISLSMLLRLFSYYYLNLDHDPWTYRFFPFEIVHFTYGILGCRLLQRHPRFFERITSASTNLAAKIGPLFLPLLAMLLLAGFWLHLRLTHTLSQYADSSIRDGGELVYLAFLPIWIVLLPILFSITRKLSVDRFVGELSYPVYLLHYTIAAIISLPALGFVKSFRGEFTAIATLLVVIPLQIWLFQPFERWRQHTFGEGAVKIGKGSRASQSSAMSGEV